MYLEMYPEEYWKWQQRMRRSFPEHWEKIKDATSEEAVIDYMNWWLGSSVSLGTSITDSVAVWMERMDRVAGGSSIILPPGVRLN